MKMVSNFFYKPKKQQTNKHNYWHKTTNATSTQETTTSLAGTNSSSEHQTAISDESRLVLLTQQTAATLQHRKHPYDGDDAFNIINTNIDQQTDEELGDDEAASFSHTFSNQNPSHRVALAANDPMRRTRALQRASRSKSAHNLHEQTFDSIKLSKSCNEHKTFLHQNHSHVPQHESSSYKRQFVLSPSFVEHHQSLHQPNIDHDHCHFESANYLKHKTHSASAALHHQHQYRHRHQHQDQHQHQHQHQHQDLEDQVFADLEHIDPNDASYQQASDDEEDIFQQLAPQAHKQHLPHSYLYNHQMHNYNRNSPSKPNTLNSNKSHPSHRFASSSSNIDQFASWIDANSPATLNYLTAKSVPASKSEHRDKREAQKLYRKAGEEVVYKGRAKGKGKEMLNGKRGTSQMSSKVSHAGDYHNYHKDSTMGRVKKVELGCCGKLAKLLLFSANSIFWICGFVLTIWGILALIEDHKYNLSQLLTFDTGSGNKVSILQLSAWSFIALGCSSIIVGFCGHSAVLKNSRCMLGVYITLILFVFALDLATGLLAIIFQEKLVTNMRVKLPTKLKSDYGVFASFTSAIDYIQTKHQCCGIEGHFDYEHSLWRLQRLGGFDATVAKTCCVLRNFNDDNAHTNPLAQNESMCQSSDQRFYQSYRFRKGCLEELETTVRNKIWYLTWCCIVVGCIVVVCVLFATCLCRSVGKELNKRQTSWSSLNSPPTTTTFKSKPTRHVPKYHRPTSGLSSSHASSKQH